MGTYPSITTYPSLGTYPGGSAPPPGTIFIGLAAYDAATTAYTLLYQSESPWKLTTASWGNTIWDVQYGGSRRSLGARPASSSIQNRQVALGLRLLPATVDAGTQHQAELNDVVERMRRYGGRVTVQHANQSHRQHLEVLASTSMMQDWTNRAEFAGRVDYALTFTCEPYVRGDSMEVTDQFTADTSTAYTFDTGASTDVAFTSGELVPTGAGVSVAMIHTSSGYQYGDVRVGCTFNVGGTVTGYLGGVILKRTAADTYIRVYVDDDGANSRLRIDKVVAGSVTNLATTNLSARVAATAPFAVYGSIEGNTVRAEHYLVPRHGVMRSSPTTTTSVVLSAGAERTTWGSAATGECGLAWTPQATTARASGFAIEPFPFTAPGAVGTRRIHGVIPGDAPALLEVVWGDATTQWFAAWSAERVDNRNYVVGGDFEETTGDPTEAPWLSGAVLTGAGTVGDVAAGGRTGSHHLTWSTAAAANRGIEQYVFGPFVAGRSYTASAWVRSASDTENVRVSLGTSTDSADGTASALSSTWSERTVTWTPAADAAVAVLAVESTSATAVGAGELDTVRVYDTLEAPTRISQLRGNGGVPTHGVLHPATVDWSNTASALTTGLSGWPYVYGAALRSTGTDDVWAKWMIDPSLLSVDDHSQSVDLEVWAGIMCGARTGVKAFTQVTGAGVAEEAAFVLYTREYSVVTGCPITGSATNVYRLGTIGVPVDTGDRHPPVMSLGVSITSTGGSGNLDLAWVVLMRPQNRVSLPTGGTWAYAPFNRGDPTVTRAMPDGRCVQMAGAGSGWRPAYGHGWVSVIDPDATHFTWVTSTGVPNDANHLGTVNTDPQLIRLTPIPRWHQLRDA